MNFLKKIWNKITEKKTKRKSRGLLYSEPPMEQRILRDYANREITRIRVDSPAVLQSLYRFTSDYIPELTPLLESYHDSRPLFDLYNIEKEIKRALERHVVMRSGGYLIIDQTEALTTIDVNTGAFIGGGDVSETILQVNIEATQVIARQLRLRNLGGIIVIDFIDMISEQHRQQVLSSLENALNQDKTKTTIYGFSALGLVELTRKRTRESLEHTLCTHCPQCKGHGSIKSIETICYKIMREVARLQLINSSAQMTVYVSPEIGEALKEKQKYASTSINVLINKQFNVRIQPLYSREQFDVITD